MHERDVTEDQILLRHTTDWMTDKGISKQRFAEMHLLPVLRDTKLVTEEPGTGDSYDLWFGSRRKMITAMLNSKQNIPLAWKWSWVTCLPDPYQKRCRQELMALNNSFYLPLPAASNTRMPTASRLADIHREFAEMVAVSKPAQDGMLDTRDEVTELKEYAGQILDLIERAAQELVNIQTGTGVMSRRQLMAMLSSRLGAE